MTTPFRIRWTRPRIAGFTLIELLVVLSIVALLLSLALPRYFRSIDASKEVILKENLSITRKTIDQYFRDTGRYPNDLQELVSRRYLHALPVDPITESTATWMLVAPSDPELGKVYDLRSGAPGATRDGTPFGAL
ncbi:prepilin-type N-terminal cleavage/methylation domain-containing protein [Cupriavidus pauculus]|nr:prepilin-type N-terminal cleavage/methylation domain-containing protein [Cupriavidus pauculus]GJG96666.1 prepilin-type N-terminal cleavage/methylation domain-containing protein [Cupriavidus pauculus]